MNLLKMISKLASQLAKAMDLLEDMHAQRPTCLFCGAQKGHEDCRERCRYRELKETVR